MKLIRKNAFRLFAAGALLGLAVAPRCHAASYLSSNKVTCNGAKYDYRLFAAPSVQPQPAILLLHGAGDDAGYFISPWTKLAKREGVVLIAPQL